MTEARSKRRVLPLFFIVKSFKKPLLLILNAYKIIFVWWPHAERVYNLVELNCKSI